MSHYLDFPLYSWSVCRLLRLADAECERDTFWVSGYSSNSFMRNGVPHFRLSKQHLMEAAVAQALCGEQCEYWSCVFLQDWLFKQGSPPSSLPCGLASVRWPAQLGWPPQGGWRWSGPALAPGEADRGFAQGPADCCDGGRAGAVSSPKWQYLTDTSSLPCAE